MAGILDGKSRIMDGQLTLRGRADLVNGGIKVKYVSFSDIGAHYEGAGGGIAETPLLVGLEAFSTPNDEITVTSDEYGTQNSFSGNGYGILRNGYATSGSATGSIQAFLLSGSLESFDNQRLISTRDVLFEDPGLIASPSSLAFSVTDTSPFGSEPSEAFIDDIESLFADKRLGRSDRFLFLPPVQRTISTVGNEAPLGNFYDVREERINEQELEEQLSTLPSQVVNFSKYTDRSELCFQLFESSSAGLFKLDIVKYGYLEKRTASGKQRDLYFVGKLFDDGYGNPTFVSLFDLVIE
jgi:hypothetical protein